MYLNGGYFMETYLSKIEGVEYVDTYKDLLSPEFYSNGEYVFVWDEKQLYKCRHTEKLIKQ